MKKSHSALIIAGVLLFSVGGFSIRFINQKNNQHTYHHPEEFIKSIEGDPRAGEKVYEAFCSNCHNERPVISVGAPRMGIAADWKHRNRNVSDMLKILDNGMSKMPPRGGCFECSDDQLTAAIEYMLPKKKS